MVHGSESAGEALEYRPLEKVLNMSLLTAANANPNEHQPRLCNCKVVSAHKNVWESPKEREQDGEVKCDVQTQECNDRLYHEHLDGCQNCDAYKLLQ